MEKVTVKVKETHYGSQGLMTRGMSYEVSKENAEILRQSGLIEGEPKGKAAEGEKVQVEAKKEKAEDVQVTAKKEGAGIVERPSAAKKGK